MKRRWSTLAGLPIFTTDKRLVGHISAAFMHPETGQIIAFLVGWTQVLPLVDIERWGHGDLQINDEEAIVAPGELIRLQEFGPAHCLLNIKSVRDKSGRRLGKLRDFTIDTTTNSLISFSVSKRFLGLEWGHRLFSWQHVSEVTRSSILLQVDMSEGEPLGRPVQAPVAT